MRVVITGVSRGLGRAMAEEFIRQGHSVAGSVRRQDVAAELVAAWDDDCRVDVVDIRDDDEVARWAEAVLAAGPVDRLINNAAAMNQPAPLWEVSAREMELLVATNILGTVNVVRHFTPAMIERGSGVIVNFSSGWGRSVSAGVAPYCATKFAVEGLTMALADDLPSGVAAVPLNPGIIDTDMLQTCFGDSASSHQKPDDWARRAVPFLLQMSERDNGEPLTVPH
jgi:NAD(P)-dependent dehydrogenase (short-subunit alcohol dehydrogenase family)